MKILKFFYFPFLGSILINLHIRHIKNDDFIIGNNPNYLVF